MNKVFAACLVTLGCVLDSSLSTILQAHGVKFIYYFTIDVYSFRFDSSFFDLWCLGVLRAAVLFGALVAILCRTEQAVIRIQALKYVILCMCTLICMFTVIKLLIISEKLTDFNLPWMWAQLAWSLAGSVIMYLQWLVLAHICLHPPNYLPLAQDDHTAAPCNNIHGASVNVTSDECGDNPASADDDTPNQSKTKRATALRLLSYSGKDWPYLCIGFIFLLISSGAEIFIPYFTGQVIEGIVVLKSMSILNHAILIMALISVVSAIGSGIRGGCFTMVINRLNIRVRNLLFSALVRQEIGFFDSIRTGDMTSRLTSDITTMSNTVGLNVNVFLRSLISALGVIGFMFKLSWQLSLVTFIGMPIAVVVSKLYGVYYKNLSKQVQDSLAKANDIAEEVLSSMRTVRSFANEMGEAARYDNSLKYTYALYKKQALAYAGFTWSNQLFELSLTVAVLYYGGHLVISNRLSGGALIAFILYQLQLGDNLQAMGYVYTGIMQAVGASEKVFEYIDRQPHILNDGKYEPDTMTGKIEFKDVTFAYPTRVQSDVLKEISFMVNPGEMVALVGPSGSGKTSCINLLEHFYEPQHGQVLLDSVPIHEYQHIYLHQQVALVGQEPILYARSIHDNIAYGLLDALSEDVRQAAILSNAHEFVAEMPAQYETQTGEKGLQLSGGQKQRIAIARALIRNPRILLLDEATSALDADSEHVVQQAIQQNLHGRTVLVIAHRLSTVERADRIIVIDKGCIQEQGTHKELLLSGGLYARLVHKQLRSNGEQDIEPLLSDENILMAPIKVSTSPDIDENSSMHDYFSTTSANQSDESASSTPYSRSPVVRFQVGSSHSQL